MQDKSNNIYYSSLHQYLSKPVWQIIFFCLIHFCIFVFWFQSPFFDSISPASQGFLVLWDYANQIANGFVPFRDFGIEYPALSLIFLTIPRLFGHSPDSYWMAFVFEMLVFDIIGLLIISAFTQKLGLSRWKTLTIYTLCLLVVGRIISIRFDIIPAVITLFSIYLFSNGKYKTSWLFLAIGFFTKLYPLIIAPLFFTYQLKRGNRRQSIECILTFVVTCTIIALPVYILNPDGLMLSIWYNNARGIQIESLYSSILLSLDKLGLIENSVNYSFGSYNIISSCSDLISKISTIIMVLSLLMIYLRYYLIRRPSSNNLPDDFWDKEDITELVKYALIVITVFIITNKVFSPQFIVWLYPFIPLIAGRLRNSTWLLFAGISVLTYIVYPVLYGMLIMQKSALSVTVLLTRNLLMIFFALILLFITNQRTAEGRQGHY